MAQHFINGDDGEALDLDALIADAVSRVLDEAQLVVDGVDGHGPSKPLESGMPCHPALAVDWTEGDAGFTDWSNRPLSGNGYGLST